MRLAAPPVMALVLVMMLAMMLGSAAAGAQEADLPCDQSFAPQLTPGLVWQGIWPAPLGSDSSARDPAAAALADLAADLAAPEDAMQAAVAALRPLPPDRAARIFAATFVRMQALRDATLAGLHRFVQQQRVLLALVDGDLRRLEAQPDDATAALLLATHRRLLDERRALRAALCDRPARIERRLGVVARALLADAP